MSKTLSSALVAMATAGALLMSPVFAAPTNSNTEAKVNTVVQDDWMSLKQAYEALEKAGYQDSDILSLTRSRFGYMANVLDGEENRIRLLINPTTGSVTAENNQYGGYGQRQMGTKRHGGTYPHQNGPHRGMMMNPN